LKVGIYGGAFDPFHKGHLSMIRGAIASGAVDQVIVIPTGMPPFKPARAASLSPYRYYMTLDALKDEPHCTVSDIEQVFGEPSYTVRTLDLLREKKIVHAKDKLYLMCGTDILFDFDSWYEPKSILEKATLLVAKRPGIPDDQVKEAVSHIESTFSTKIHFFDIKGVEVASSEIRIEENYEDDVPESVAKFIRRHDLYAHDAPLSGVSDAMYAKLIELSFRLFDELSEKRLLHSMNTAIVATRYAVRFGVNPDQCAIAGLLHDCAKELPLETQIALSAKIITEYIPGKEILHSPAGAQYAHEHFGVEDKVVLDAIQYHTVGREIMTPVEKVVYLADKLEPSRDYDDLSTIRSYAEKDLNAALIECYCAIKESFARKGKCIHEDTQKSLAYLLANRSQ